MAFTYGTLAHRAALATDDVWSAELTKRFGKRAGDVRYTLAGRGEAGDPLNMAYEAHLIAQEAWAKECQS